MSPFFTKSFIYNFPVVQKNVQKSYVCVLRHDIMIIDAAHSDIRAYFMRSRWKNKLIINCGTIQNYHNTHERDTVFFKRWKHETFSMFRFHDKTREKHTFKC